MSLFLFWLTTHITSRPITTVYVIVLEAEAAWELQLPSSGSRSSSTTYTTHQWHINLSTGAHFPKIWNIAQNDAEPLRWGLHSSQTVQLVHSSGCHVSSWSMPYISAKMGEPVHKCTVSLGIQHGIEQCQTLKARVAKFRWYTTIENLFIFIVTSSHAEKFYQSIWHTFLQRPIFGQDPQQHLTWG